MLTKVLLLVTTPLSALTLACSSGDTESATPTTSAATATVGSATTPASGATTAPSATPGLSTASAATPTTAATTAKVNANTATRAQLQAAFEAAGISNAAQWSREVEEYRPYPTNDPDFAKLRQELAKYNPGPGIVDRIVATLVP